MSPSIFDSQRVGFTCPKCGAKVNAKVGDLRSSRMVHCSKCNQKIKAEGAELDRTLKKLDDSIDKLKRLGK